MNKKRLLAIVVSVVMLVSAVAVLAACFGGEFDLDWNNYLVDYDTYVRQNGGSTSQLPSFSKVLTSLSSSAYVSDSYANYGLIRITDSGYSYGYSLAGNTVFGRYDSLTSAPTVASYGDVITYMGSSSSYMYLYDVNGNSVTSGRYIEVGDTYTVGSGDSATTYLEVRVGDYSYDTETRYYEVYSSGSISYWTSELPSENGNSSNYYSVGDSLKPESESLANLLGIGNSGDEYDSTLNSIYVSKLGRNWTFYRYGYQELSTLTEPLNLDNVVYVDGCIIYTTKTPVDQYATKGYNYVSGSSKYYVETFSFDIERGRSSSLNTDYIITSFEGNWYNRTDRTYDLAEVEALRMIDGVAWQSESSRYTDTLLIDANGSIGFSELDSEYGLPQYKLTSDDDSNFIARGNGATFMVSAKGDILATFAGNPVAVTSDSLYITVDGKLGAIDFYGKVSVSFDYEYLTHMGLYAAVERYGTEYVLNLSTGRTTSLSSLVSSRAQFSYNGYIYVENNDGTYNWYDLSGNRIVSNVVNSYLSVSTFTLNNNTYRWLSVQDADYDYTYLRAVA